MREKNEQELYQTLSDTQRLLKGLDPTGERYSLESILEEFGASGGKPAAQEKAPAPEAPVAASSAEEPIPAKDAAPAEPEAAPAPSMEAEGESVPPSPLDAAEPMPEKPVAPPTAVREPVAGGERRAKVLTFPTAQRPLPPEEPEEREEPAPAETAQEISAEAAEELEFEHLVAETVGSVLDVKRPEKEEKKSLLQRLKRGDRAARAEEPPDEEAEELLRWQSEEEPPAAETHAALRREYAKLKREFRLSLLPAGMGLLLTVLGELGVVSALLKDAHMALVQSMLLLCACLCGAAVFQQAVEGLKERRFTAELLTALCAAVTLADGLSAVFSETARSGAPLSLVSMFAVSFALAGRMLETRARKDSFRLLSVGDPGAVVAESPDGILKQKGRAAGFSNGMDADNAAARWQGLLLPLIFVAAVVFTALATVGQGRKEELLWCLSALLTAANGFTLPLCYALPFSRVARRLYHSGAAVAGYLGARIISRSRRMILTDRDLFPEGTVHLNGIKIYGEEIGKVVSYAASLARRSGSGLANLFDDLLVSEGACLQKLDEFAFSDHGGYSAVIHGETTLLGTDKFLRRSNVAIPQGMKLKNALFLAVDGRLIAAFAVKYPQVSSTEWAIHSLRRTGVAPVLASRDPNLTPSLLKQRFGTDARAVYPSLSERLTLSDPQRQRPGLVGAALYREGLMPYAEAVVASRRLCRVTRQLTALALAGSVLSLLLCFYLAFAGAASALSPLMLTVYQLLWAFGGLLIGMGTDRY